MSGEKWYLRTQDETFGPETREKLVEWARLGRIQPGQELSDDNVVWRKVEDVPFLDMRYSIDLGDGNPRGPFNKDAADALIASGRLPPTATVVETRAPFDEDAPKPVDEEQPDAQEAAESPAVKVVEKIVEVPVEKIVEKVVVKEVPVEVEKIVEVEKVVEKEVPVEVEKIIEKRVEVPVEVEKVVEKIVEKVVIDESRVKELEEILETERRHTAELQSQMDAALKASSEREAEAQEKLVAQVKEASAREGKLREQVVALENELRRLPQTASEIADIQAAVYSIMTGEAEEIRKIQELERAEMDEFRRRHQERADRLLERRRELLKRAGANIEDMTRRALIDRPEDPRTAQLRKEYSEFRKLSERRALEADRRIAELAEQLRVKSAEQLRAAEGMKDVTQLRAELEALKEQLHLREKELMSERQQNEMIRQQQATSQQMYVARLAQLESPTFGTIETQETNQSREAKLVKLPSWMRMRK